MHASEHLVIAAAARLRGAWRQDDLDIVEMQEAAFGLMLATNTRNLSYALDVLHDIETCHDDRSH